MATRKKQTTKKRTTKKAAAKKKAAAPTIQTDELGNKYLDPLDLKTLELADYKWRSVKQERALKEREKVDVIGRLDKRIMELVSSESRLLGQLKKVREELGAKYKVNFDDPSLSYDDETGRIVHQPLIVRK